MFFELKEDVFFPHSFFFCYENEVSLDEGFVWLPQQNLNFGQGVKLSDIQQKKKIM